jgi:hypothetical protein
MQAPSGTYCAPPAPPASSHNRFPVAFPPACRLFAPTLRQIRQPACNRSAVSLPGFLGPLDQHDRLCKQLGSCFAFLRVISFPLSATGIPSHPHQGSEKHRVYNCRHGSPLATRASIRCLVTCSPSVGRRALLDHACIPALVRAQRAIRQTFTAFGLQYFTCLLHLGSNRPRFFRCAYFPLRTRRWKCCSRCARATTYILHFFASPCCRRLEQ